MPSEQDRKFCFTKFCDEKTWANEKPTFNADKMDYLCYQVEIAPTTGKYHFQGYMRTKGMKKMTLKIAAESLGIPWGTGGHHIEFARTEEAAIRYCQKTETAVANSFEEHGVRPKKFGQGNRSDFDKVLKECKNAEEVAEKYPGFFAKYHNGINAVYCMKAPKRVEKPKVYVFWGPGGSGKTKAAFDEASKLGTVYKIQGGTGLKWWPCYQQETCTIIDEFRGEDVNVNNLLPILDRYKHKLETKGGHVEFNSPFIFITSSIHPRFWYPNRWGEMKRRITKIVEFKENPALIEEPIEEEWDGNFKP